MADDPISDLIRQIRRAGAVSVPVGGSSGAMFARISKSEAAKLVKSHGADGRIEAEWDSDDDLVISGTAEAGKWMR